MNFLFLRICINSNFARKTLKSYNFKLVILHKMQLQLNIVTTQQRRKWNSEKLQDHTDCRTRKENSDLWEDVGPEHSPWNRNQGMDLLCSTPPPPPGFLALQVSFLTLAPAGCRRHLSRESLILLLHWAACNWSGVTPHSVESVRVIPWPCLQS